MFRVYVGNLDPAVDEESLRGLFEENGIEVGNILKKRNYAFVDCPDQANVDRAIDNLHGKLLSCIWYSRKQNYPAKPGEILIPVTFRRAHGPGDYQNSKWPVRAGVCYLKTAFLH